MLVSEMRSVGNKGCLRHTLAAATLGRVHTYLIPQVIGIAAISTTFDLTCNPVLRMTPHCTVLDSSSIRVLLRGNRSKGSVIAPSIVGRTALILRSGARRGLCHGHDGATVHDTTVPRPTEISRTVPCWCWCWVPWAHGAQRFARTVPCWCAGVGTVGIMGTVALLIHLEGQPSFWLLRGSSCVYPRPVSSVHPCPRPQPHASPDRLIQMMPLTLRSRSCLLLAKMKRPLICS